MVNYQYQRIRKEKEFRLLELLPGLDNQKIQCQMKSAHIDDGQKYEAVSYRWGTAEIKNTILCDGKTLIIPRNCATVLCWLRDKKKTRRLWIDAICIDQQNNDEVTRAEFQNQLKLAKDVYNNAVRVVAFLGSGTGNTKIIMEYLRWCGRFMRYAPFNKRNPKNLARPLSIFQSLLLRKTGLSQQQFLDELRGIIENEYFTRAWTVQEIAVSTACTIMCQDTSISWTTFGIAARCITPELDSDASKRREEVFRSYMIHWMLWKRFRDSVAGNRHAGLHNDGLEQCNLGDVLRYSKYQSAKYKKDKVWALYGVLQKLGVQLNDDYATDELQVFSTATFEVIKTSRSLKVFLTLPEHKRSPDLPSWVPDWTQDYPFMAHLGLDHFKASGVSQCTPQLVQPFPNSVLKLKGKNIGRLNNCLTGDLNSWGKFRQPNTAELSISSHDKVSWQIKLVQEWMRMALPEPSHWKPSLVLRRFFDTMDPMIESRRGANPTHTRHLKLSLFCDFWRTSTSKISGMDWIQTFPDPSMENIKLGDADEVPAVCDEPRVVWDRVKRKKHVERYLSVLIEKMSNYSIFMDSQGRVGLAFHTVRPGHEILLLAGAAAPIIASKGRERWEIVAPAYIYGAMNGREWSNEANMMDEFEFE